MKSATATLQFELEKLAPAGRVGVIALATDFNICLLYTSPSPRDED